MNVHSSFTSTSDDAEFDSASESEEPEWNTEALSTSTSSDSSASTTPSLVSATHAATVVPVVFQSHADFSTSEFPAEEASSSAKNETEPDFLCCLEKAQAAIGNFGFCILP